MSLLDSLARPYRIVLLTLLAVGLLATPLVATTLPLGETIYEYQRVEVTVDNGTIDYSDLSDVPWAMTPISDDLKCARGSNSARICSFERRVLADGFLATDIYREDQDADDAIDQSRTDYDYVQLNGTVYEPTAVGNSSVQNDEGAYRLDLTLESVDPAVALERVSLPIGFDDIPPAVAEAARTGSATVRGGTIDVPETPIQLEDGTHYRVYKTWDSEEPAPIESVLKWVLTYVTPLIGLVVAVRLVRDCGSPFPPE